MVGERERDGTLRLKWKGRKGNTHREGHEINDRKREREKQNNRDRER